jgi:hypothetical protein
MTEICKWERVNTAETIEDLQLAILHIADKDNMINGRNIKFDAAIQAGHVENVVNNNYPPNLLVRSYGIRQQALFIKHYLSY